MSHFISLGFDILLDKECEFRITDPHDSFVLENYMIFLCVFFNGNFRYDTMKLIV